MAERRPRVIVGVDESEASARALDLAAWEARSLSRPLELVRGVELPAPSPFTGYVPYDDAARAARSWVSRAVDEARQRFPDLEISGSAVTGRGAPALLDRATDSDLLVVGSRSRSATRSILLGSVSGAVAAHAECPVIVVRGQAGEGRRIVVGADGSARGRAAVEFAFDEAARRALPLEIITAWELEPYGVAGFWSVLVAMDEYEQSLEEQTENEIAEFRQKYSQVEARVVVVQAQPAAALVERSHGTALLVVGSRGHGGIAGLLLGSVSQAVLHHANCPVAVVHRKEKP